MEHLKLVTRRVSSIMIFWQVVLRYSTIAILFILIVLFIPGRGGDPILLKYNVPNYIFVIGYALTFIFVVLLMYMYSAQLYKKNKICFSQDYIEYNRVKFDIADISHVDIKLNPMKYKRLENRSLLNGGGNNWIKFRCHGKLHVYEFLIRSKVDEELFNDILRGWEKKIRIKVTSSKENELLDLFSSKEYYC